MYLALLDAAGRDPRPPLERAYSGGSSLPPAVLRRVEEVLGAPVYEGCGLTETSPSVSYHQPGHERRAGTVGLPIPGVEGRHRGGGRAAADPAAAGRGARGGRLRGWRRRSPAGAGNGWRGTSTRAGSSFHRGLSRGPHREDPEGRTGRILPVDRLDRSGWEGRCTRYEKM
ncbi:AMP-binding protein [Streptomyces katrae]|uniref:AMP-binding protein n=1 Tax=Streptomyces katrae TaxID=68223 RepID=UPI003003599F